MMISYVYVNKEGLQEGPVSPEGLEDLVARGIVTSRTMISDGTDAWSPAGMYPPTMGMFRAPIARTHGVGAPKVTSAVLEASKRARSKVEAHGAEARALSWWWRLSLSWGDVNFVALCLKVVAVLPLLMNLVMLIVYSRTERNVRSMEDVIRTSQDEGMFRVLLFLGLPSAVILGLFIYGFASILLMLRALVMKRD